jgi:putative PIN family toxin of toxin-antitoxin system
MAVDVVLDTNVLVAAMRSRQGASYRLLTLVGSGKFEVSVSVGLVLEYEDALTRLALVDRDDQDDVLDYVCAVANKPKVYYLWRPMLRDPNDDLVLEVAVAGGCEAIVTFNKRDFGGAEGFGIRVLSPREFLVEIGELK